MESKDLRIGVSWVLCNGIRTIVNLSLLESIEKGDVRFIVNPIPLTEEVFFGLPVFSRRFLSRYRVVVCFMCYKKGVCVFKEKPIVIEVYCDFRKKIFFINHNKQKVFLKYVHQLQNLYHALTGEELTFDM